jgi:hypothetical protein
MKPSAAPASPEGLQPQEAPRQPGETIQDETTGVPGFRTWTGIYWVVLGSLALWVALLALLTEALS